jgi:hypothetical protein
VNSQSENESPIELKSVELFIVDQISCKRSYPDISDNIICAAAPGKKMLASKVYKKLKYVFLFQNKGKTPAKETQVARSWHFTVTLLSVL